MRFASFASGSAGNSAFISSGNTHILIDAGIAAKNIEKCLCNQDIKPEELSAILITHEHTDHVKGLKVFLKHSPLPVYATKATIARLCEKDRTLQKDCFIPVEKGERFRVGELDIKTFAIPHDAADPLGYRVSDGEKSAAVATDLGHITDEMKACLKGLDVLLLEANHDVNMLLAGPYPYALKQRILGDLGHLSNENCGRFLAELLHENIKKIFLGHLSAHNNYPDLALASVGLEVDMSDTEFHAGDFPIEVAGQNAPTETFEF